MVLLQNKLYFLKDLEGGGPTFSKRWRIQLFPVGVSEC